MAEIRPVDEIARKWASVTPLRAADYEKGIRDPKGDWAKGAIAAADAWKSGIQAAVANNSFTKGVTRAGTQAWQEGSLSKGLARWGPGVALAVDKYQTNFAPFREVIARTVLPPRFARRDPRNLERVKVIAEALAKAKVAMGS